ncbi:MAG TPA: hypothetical protein VGI82_14710 [Chitinophagaceae bacterium]
MSPEVYKLMVHLHSVIRWVILLLLLIAIFNSLTAGNRPFTRGDARIGSLLTGFADLTLLIGLVLYFFNSKGIGYHSFDNSSFSAVMKDKDNELIRFFAVEHIVAMLIAIILLHIGKAQGKKAISDKAKHRRTLVFYLLALLIILVSIPWPFRQIGAASGWY